MTLDKNFKNTKLIDFINYLEQLVHEISYNNIDELDNARIKSGFYALKELVKSQTIK